MPFSKQVLDVVSLVGSDIKNPAIYLDPINGSVAINEVPVAAKPISQPLSCARASWADRQATSSQIRSIPYLVSNAKLGFTG
jgi:hypothetical protein